MGCLGSEVEYAVIPTELDESADVHGDDLSDAAKQCRFRALVVEAAMFLLALGDLMMPWGLQYFLMLFPYKMNMDSIGNYKIAVLWKEATFANHVVFCWSTLDL